VLHDIVILIGRGDINLSRYGTATLAILIVPNLKKMITCNETSPNMADESGASVQCASQESHSAEAESPGIVEGLVSKRNTKAFIWKYYGFSTDGNG